MSLPWWSFDVEAVAAWGLRTALAVGVLALGAWAVERLLRRQLAPRVRVALWSLVLVRSVMPFSLPLPLSDEFSRWTAALPVIEATSVAARWSGGASLGAQSAPDLEPMALSLEHVPGSAPTAVLGKPFKDPVRKASWLILLLAIWGVGTIVHAVRWVRLDRRFRRHALEGAEPAPAWIKDRVAHLAQRMGIARVPAVWTVDASLGPAVLHGLARPMLFLSVESLSDDADAVDAVLTHELEHHRGLDRYWMLAVAAVRSVWWFHPAVQWAAARWLHGLELTRDADAIRTLGTGSHVGYARALLNAAAGSRSPRRIGVLGLGWGSTTGGAGERIRLAAVPGGATRRARWVGGIALLGLGTAAVVTAAGNLQEGSIAGGSDLDRRLAVLEFSAASKPSAVEVVAQRYGLNIIAELGFPTHRLNAKGSEISAREALDFVVRDYTGGSWRVEGSGVIRVSMPAAEDGRSRTREYDFSSVIQQALSANDTTEASKDLADEATAKLRKALVETADKALKHAYPESHCELTMEGDRMRLVAEGRCHEALASLRDGLRYPIPLVVPERTMPVVGIRESTLPEGTTVGAVLSALEASTGYLMASKDLTSRQLEQKVTLPKSSPLTVISALTEIGRTTECTIHVGARSIVLSNSRSASVRAYSVGRQSLPDPFLITGGKGQNWDEIQRDAGAMVVSGASISVGSAMAMGVAGSVVLSTTGGPSEAFLLLAFAGQSSPRARFR